MKLSGTFPSMSYREGGDAALHLARDIEAIDCEQVDVFNPVVMAFPAATRQACPYIRRRRPLWKH